MSGIRIGQVTHFFGRINVAAIVLTDTLCKGDRVHFLGRTTDFEQVVTSMEIDHQSVEKAEKGQDVGVRVLRRVRPRDKVYKLEGEE